MAADVARARADTIHEHVGRDGEQRELGDPGFRNPGERGGGEGARRSTTRCWPQMTAGCASRTTGWRFGTARDRVARCVMAVTRVVIHATRPVVPAPFTSARTQRRHDVLLAAAGRSPRLASDRQVRRSRAMAIDALDILYLPSRDVEADIRFYRDTLGARVASRSRRWAPAWQRSRSRSTVRMILADHLPGDAPVLLHRVSDLDETLSELGARGLELEAQLELPLGPCATLRSPGGQRLGLYELDTTRGRRALRRTHRLRLTALVTAGLNECGRRGPPGRWGPSQLPRPRSARPRLRRCRRRRRRR